MFSVSTVASLFYDANEKHEKQNIVQSCFAGGFGFEFSDDILGKNENLSSLLFNEYSGAFIVSISPQEKAVIKEAFPQTELRYLGKTKTHGNFILENNIDLSIVV